MFPTKFTIRDLFLVTMIVALALGWWMDMSRVQARLTKELEWRAALERVDEFPGHPEVKLWQEMPTYSAPTPNPLKP